MKEHNQMKRDAAPIIIILLSAVIGFIYINSFTDVLKGDAEAFGDHFSFGITAEDAERAKLDFYNEADVLDEAYNINPYRHLHEYGDQKYSNHYGAYSALVVPVKMVLKAFGGYPVKAFYYTNFLLYMAAVVSVLFLSEADSKQKLIIILLLIINPAVFYLSWIHTEIFIFSFVVIGLVFYYDNKHGRAIFFLSVASMQNLAVLPFAMMVGIDLIVQMIRKYRKTAVFKALPYALCYIPGLVPVISTYYRFHTINLVKEVSMENRYLLHKAFDYAFDLNLGIFPYEPVILLLFILMAVAGLWKCTEKSLINILGVCGMVYVISNQLQINCGMQYIARYNVWIIPVLIFFVVMNWREIWGSDKMLYPAAASELAVTAFVILRIWSGVWDFSCNQFAPWTQRIMSIAPEIYNPSHGIFYSRVAGKETYHSDRPAVYTDLDGHVRKILLSSDAHDIFDSDEFILVDTEGNEIDKERLQRITIDEGDYTYINITGDVFLP